MNCSSYSWLTQLCRTFQIDYHSARMLTASQTETSALHPSPLLPTVRSNPSQTDIQNRADTCIELNRKPSLHPSSRISECCNVTLHLRAQHRGTAVLLGAQLQPWPLLRGNTGRACHLSPPTLMYLHPLLWGRLTPTQKPVFSLSARAQVAGGSKVELQQRYPQFKESRRMKS